MRFSQQIPNEFHFLNVPDNPSLSPVNGQSCSFRRSTSSLPEAKLHEDKLVAKFLHFHDHTGYLQLFQGMTPKGHPMTINTGF